jgi:4-amino-4-deoxy-L-arabinose transferase-like glycosyltransferase
LKAPWPAVSILLVYLIVGSLYAAATPVWQAPDEPAHYNYIRSLAIGQGLPVMEPGDYDQDYLSELTSRGFPDELPVVDLEYEDHQPPLYYLLAAPVFWISGGSVLLLRLFSLVIGGVSVIIVMLILREFWPQEPGIAWLGGGLVAFIPQFLAISASVNNDVLVFALLWLWLWLALRYVRGLVSPWSLGALAGALLLTKTTGYGVLPLTVLVVYLRYRRAGMPMSWLASQMVAMLLPALVLGGAWWVRNAVVYGWPDILGLQRHNAVVMGQPRTADAIAEQGLHFFRSGAWTVFRSFWGQFGWMGVVVDQRIYHGLVIFSLLTAYGAMWRLAEAWMTGFDPRQRDALLILAASAGITVVMFLGYNVTFVQHQGRYLFPALPLLAIGAALGWQRLLDRRLAVGAALILSVMALGVGVRGLISGSVPLWPLAMLAATVVGLPILASLPEKWHGFLIVGGLGMMALLDLWCLFGFIVPMLA